MGPMRCRGYTLVELLITLAVVTVLLGLGLPSFQHLLATERGAAAMNQMLGAVSLARSQAVLQRHTVTLCPGDATGCLGRHQWHRGALVFVDRDGDARLDPGDTLVRAFPGLTPGERIYWRAFRNRSYLQFHRLGYTRWQNGNFLYCPPDNDARRARMVILNAAGRLRSARDSDGNGIVENASGRDVVCPP